MVKYRLGKILEAWQNVIKQHSLVVKCIPASAIVYECAESPFPPSSPVTSTSYKVDVVLLSTPDSSWPHSMDVPKSKASYWLCVSAWPTFYFVCYKCYSQPGLLSSFGFILCVNMCVFLRCPCLCSLLAHACGAALVCFLWFGEMCDSGNVLGASSKHLI